MDYTDDDAGGLIPTRVPQPEAEIARSVLPGGVIVVSVSMGDDRTHGAPFEVRVIGGPMHGAVRIASSGSKVRMVHNYVCGALREGLGV